MAIDFSILNSSLLANFSESITYVPASGDERTIDALIDRRIPPQPVPPGRGVRSFLLVSVANNSTTGISSAEIDTGGDTLRLAKRLGETATTVGIAKIVSHDNGMMTLEVR